MSLSKLRAMVKDREAWRAAVHGSPRVRHDRATEQQQTSGVQTVVLSFSRVPTEGLPSGPVVTNLPAHAGDPGLTLVQEDFTSRGGNQARVPQLQSPHATNTEV